MGASSGIASRPIDETSFAVIDFETTGLTPGYDRVIEVAVERLDPGSSPRLVLETLINPQRSVAATEIHGISDADVVGAPLFRDIAGDLVDALSGCVVAAYNVYFDIKFLAHELQFVALDHLPPHVCLMYFRPLLGLGSRCRLEEACRNHGIRHDATHIAAGDVQASSRLMALYLEVLRHRNVQTFAELAELGNYKFLSSLKNEPFSDAARFKLQPSGRRKSRYIRAEPKQPPVAQECDKETLGLRAYWDALKTAVADLHITSEEVAEIARIREQFELSTERVRALHARAYASVIAQFVDDRFLDDFEARKLQKFHRCLSELGWAPGE